MSVEEQAKRVSEKGFQQVDERAYIRDRCPRSEESGLVHPKTKGGIYFRDSDTMDLFMRGDIGSRWHRPTESRFDRAPYQYNKGKQWAGLFDDSYALETQNSLYTKTKNAFLKIRDSFRAKVHHMYQIAAKEDVVFGANRFWIRCKKQISLIADGVFSIECDDIRLKTEVTNISINGHKLDRYVMHTEEMYQDIRTLKSFISQFKTLFDTHVHTGWFGTTLPPLILFPPLELQIQPVAQPQRYRPLPRRILPGEDDLPLLILRDLESVNSATWDYRSDSEWGNNQ